MANIYEGNKPFVFISYCHKDKPSVMPIIEALEASGVRLWYDRSIEGGEKWEKCITAHIKASSCFLLFVSHNYEGSENCLRELTFASKYKIPTVSMFLERFQPGDDLEWNLCREQWQYCDDFPSARALADKLIRAPKVAACRIDGSNAEKKLRPAAPAPVQQSVKLTAANFLKRATIALEDGDWGDAAAFCEQVLNMDPENPQAYLTLLLAKMKVKNTEQLATAAAFSEDNKYYKKLLRFADEATKASLAQALTKAKNEKLRAENEAAKVAPSPAQALTKAKNVKLRAENEAAEVAPSPAQALTTAKNEKLRAENEAAKVDFKKNATIENGVLKKYNGSEAHVSIPNDVIIISEKAFSGCKALTSVTIPDSVTRIGRYAFENCERLTSVTIPNSVTSIGTWAFFSCKALTSVTIPDSVSYIDANPFADCSNLTEIVVSAENPLFFVENGHLIDKRTKTLISGCANTPIPTNGSVIRIGNTAFSRCEALTSVTIPDSVTGIDEYAFSGCKALTSVTIPGSVSHIAKNPFSGCGNLAEIAVSAENPNFFVENGHLIDKRTKTLITGCRALTSVTIPNSVTRIGESAFSGCSALTSVTIPDSVTSIGESAFSGCSALTSVTIPNGVTRIEAGAFSSCGVLTSVTIPNGVTSIGFRAFSGCSALPSVTIPNSVTSIGLSAFSDCINLTLVTIPDGITKIGFDIFSGCIALTSVTIPSSVTWISEDAFKKCDNITIFTPKNSFAWKWAEKRHIPVKKMRTLGMHALLPIIGK